MNVSSPRKQHGSVHRIREFELEKVNLSDEFDILQIVGEGWFGKILLVEHRATDTEMVLKALPKPYVSLRDFYREFHYGLHLGAHKNIVTTFDVAFETAGFYVFTQEYAPLGDLTSNVSDIGIGEVPTKRVAKQIASALDYIHSKDLVHRDVKLDNVLVCRSDFSRVKLCDFGETRKAYTYVQRRNEWIPYSPPEVLAVSTDHTYQTVPSHDLWQFGIILFVCLTGCLPWQKAASDDPRYMRYFVWQNSTMVIPIKRTPKLFKLLTNRACKLFRKFLEPIPERRPKSSSDLHKFLDDRWLAKNAEKDMIANEPDELCASMYSFHSSPEEKNKLLFALTQHGIETTVDRVAKKNRIRDWIQESVIAEEEDEDDEQTEDDGRELQTRTTRVAIGHVSSVRAAERAERAARTQIVSTVKDATNKHINPRTGKIQQGPSEMGHHGHSNETLTSLHNDKHSDTTSSNLSESCQENNSHAYHHGSSNAGAMANRRLLVDVASQTSNESQMQPPELASVNNFHEMTERPNAHNESYEMNNSHSVPSISHVQMTKNGKPHQRNTNKVETTSRGYVSAFNSLATIAVPDIQKYKQPISTATKHRDRGCDRSQSIKHNHHQRHNTTALAKHPMSRSMHNFNNLINDSAYGSIEKLRPIDNSILSTPILSKRSIKKPVATPSNGAATGTGARSSNERIHINGISHSQNENSSPFHSDSGGDGSPRGSNGFVNLTGTKRSMTPTPNEKPPTTPATKVTTPPTTFRASMKGTAYDHVRSNRRNKWNDL